MAFTDACTQTTVSLEDESAVSSSALWLHRFCTNRSLRAVLLFLQDLRSPIAQIPFVAQVCTELRRWRSELASKTMPLPSFEVLTKESSPDICNWLDRICDIRPPAFLTLDLVKDVKQRIKRHEEELTYMENFLRSNCSACADLAQVR